MVLKLFTHGSIKKRREKKKGHAELHFRRPRSLPQKLTLLLPVVGAGCFSFLASTILLTIDHADSGVLRKRSRAAPFFIIISQHPLLISASRFSLTSRLRALSHIVVTRMTLCAHWSPHSSPNLDKLRPGFPVIRVSVIRCKYMIPDNETLLQRFHSNTRKRIKLNQRTFLEASR
jgi:hypothetical protein